MKPPVIGVSIAVHSKNYGILSLNYLDAIAATGALPVLIPPMSSLEQFRNYEANVFPGIDGWVLTGDNGDLDCQNDGYRLHPSMKLMNKRREQWDRWLARYVYLNRRPVLAIGMGMQLLNIACGGNLSLDIAEDHPSALPHYDQHDEYHAHGLIVQPNVLLDMVWPQNACKEAGSYIRVVSQHHQCVDELAACFKVAAQAPDGIIEAYESEAPGWFAVGVQFHPEHPADAVGKAIFTALTDHITGDTEYWHPVSIPVEEDVAA